MPSNSREQLASAAMIATHDVISTITESKAALESMLFSMNELLCLVTLEGRILWGNARAADWLGLEHDDLPHQSLAAQLGSDFWEQCRSAWTSRGPAAEVELQTQTALGEKERELLWTLSRFEAMSERRGTILLVNARDVSEILKERSSRVRLETELETAGILQEAFLPQSQIEDADLSLAAYYRAAERCSGDWWGTFEVGPQQKLLCVADVTGHGTASAMVAAMTHAVCMDFALRQKANAVKEGPEILLAHLNAVIHGTFQGETYVTCFAVIVDRLAKRLLFANASHNFPYFLPKGGAVQSLIAQGNPIGYRHDTVYSPESLAYESGDRLVLYTDGLPEARNGEGRAYGSGAFRRSILKHAGLELTAFCTALVGGMQQFVQDTPLSDDVTLVCCNLKE